MDTNEAQAVWRFDPAAMRRRRDELGYSQLKVAGAAGLTLNTIGLVERGEVDPKIGTVARIAAALHLEPAALLSEGDS